jgi:hypothetical protein
MLNTLFIFLVFTVMTFFPGERGDLNADRDKNSYTGDP